MAKNKAELQSDAENYRISLARMREAHGQSRFLDAIEIAVASLDYVDGMMQFERRFEGRGERGIVETIDYVIRYAPLLFDQISLERVASLLKSQKRVDKNTTADIAEELQQAFTVMWDAHRLWTELEQSGELRQDKLRMTLGGDHEKWRSISEFWELLGLIRRIPEEGSYRLSFATQITAEIRGKCRGCGATGKAAMGRFLEEITCPKCKATSTFVLIRESPEVN